ncbi:MAG: TM0106 family RecB-like putative nuclease [Kovacikia sp.]
MLIDADLLLNYQRCSRRAFLDKYGNLDRRDPPNDYLLKLMQDSQVNQQSVISEHAFHQPFYAARDWQKGAEATLALMQQGTERIYQGALLLEEASGVRLVSNPDLLVKQAGQSIFGDWLYVPTEIKLGKRPKLEYQITAAYHVYVLSQVQGAWPETVWLLLRERGLYAVDLWEVLPRMQEILEECIQTLSHSQEPEVFISRNRCSLCHWFSHCYAVAKAEQHLSLLPGVTPTRYLQLQALNLTTVKSLADTNPAQLEPLPGFGREAAHKLVRQARSTLQNRALPIEGGTDSHSNRLPTSRPSLSTRPTHSCLATAELPTAPVELYFDIEAEPALNLVYLHGVLVIDRQAKTETFHSFLAERSDHEPAVWQEFLDLVWTYPTAPIFHFCPFEVQTVERLAKLYNTPSHRITPLLTRFVDLHERVTRLVTLPVESYALKPIARWLGFDWRDSTANGAQSIYWYAQWQATGDRTYLDSILTYNEDDCRATYHVKDWLINFLQTVYQAELA